jgi:predicted AlkP superfamily pyrophosphatase or phosphodiesterase
MKFKKSMKTIVILVDALRGNYLNAKNMPFLNDLAKKSIYVKEVKPSFGFCERTEIFTGMTPKISKNLTAIGYDPGRSEYANINCLLYFLSIIEKINRYYTRKISSKIFNIFRKEMQIYEIPFRSLSKYALTEDSKDLDEYDAFNNESIIDVARKENIKISLNAFTSMRMQKTYLPIEKKIKYIKKCSEIDVDCAFLYIGDIDKYGHMYADDIKKMKSHLNRTDDIIKEIYSYFMDKCIPFNLVVLGDHGMVPIHDTINISNLIEDTRLTLGRDYEMFLDSTIARFWFFNKDAEYKYFLH